VQLKASGTGDRESIVQRPAWSGLLVEGGLPGTVRVLFNYIGVGTAGTYYTLYEDEHSLKVRFWLQTIQWAVLGLFVIFLIFLQTRTIRKLERPDDAAADPSY
jgi:hypothetical protein